MKPCRHTALMSILMGGSKRVTAIVTSKGMKKKELLLFMGKCTQRTFKERKKKYFDRNFAWKEEEAVLSRIIYPVLFLKRCFAHFICSIRSLVCLSSIISDIFCVTFYFCQGFSNF